MLRDLFSQEDHQFTFLYLYDFIRNSIKFIINEVRIYADYHKRKVRTLSFPFAKIHKSLSTYTLLIL